MKIVMASHHFPPRYTGGVELITQRAAHWLLDQGYEVEIVCIEVVDYGNVATKLEAKLDIYEGIPVHRLYLTQNSQEDPFRNSYCNPVIGTWFEKCLDVVKPDIFHIQSCYLLSASIIDAAKKTKIPTILSLHDYWFICPRITLLHPNDARCEGPSPVDCTWCLKTENRRYRLPDQVTGGILGKVVRKTLTSSEVATQLGWQPELSAQAKRLSYTTKQLNSVDLVVTQAQLVRSLMIKQGVGADHVKLVPYGLSLNGKNSVVSPRSDRPFRIGYLGNLLPFKGAHMLIAAFKQLRAAERQVELYFYGDKNKLPDYTQRLQKLATNDPRIVFAGRYSNDEVEKILSTFDVLVVPSLWYEIGPLVTMEAFISKIPVVAANIPNMMYQVTHQVNGLLYEADSVEDLARQLQRLVDDPQFLTSLRQGIGPVRSFEQEMNDWTEIYQSILTKRQGESSTIQTQADILY